MNASPESPDEVLDGFQIEVRTKPSDHPATTTADASSSGPPGRAAPVIMDNPRGSPVWWFATASR